MPDKKDAKTGLNEGYKASRMAGVTNAAFAGSMVLSTITMFSGATGEAATKLQMFSTALMTAMLALQMIQGMGIGGKLVGGVARAGGGIARAGTALSGVGGGIGRFGGLLAAGGSALAGGGTAAIVATGGIAAAVIAAGAGLYLYKKSLDEARERAMAAFKDPVETVKFFGKEVKNVTDSLKEIQASNAVSALEDVNAQLREAVSSDYATLIEKIKNSVVTVGATDLGAAYTKMIISGLSAEEATDAIKAIAAEAGTAGGAAYAKAFGEGLLKSRDPEDAFNQMLNMIDPNSEYNRRRVASLQNDQRAIESSRYSGFSRGYSGYTKAQIDQLGSIAEAMEISGETFAATVQAAIQLSQTSPEIVAQNAEKIRQAYLSLDAGGGFGWSQSEQGVAYDSFKNMIGELNDPMLNKIMDSLQNATPEAQALAIELVAIGGDLNDAADAAGRFNIDMAQAAIRNTQNLRHFEQAAKDATEAVLDLANSDEFNTRIERNEKRLERFSKARDRYVKDREEEKEALQEAFDATQEGIENEIKALNKEQDRINRVTNAYLKSLSKRAEADKFYANQRKTSLGALQSLASGNVFGFLQAREQMGEQARDFSYQNEIQKIEDKRDAEIDAIDRAIDKKNEQIDLNNKAHDEQMKAFDKETEKHSKELDKQYKRQSAHVNSMKNLQKEIADGQIVTYDEMKKAYGKRLADEYKMLVENQIKATALELRAQVTAGRMEGSEAQKRLIDMYNALQGGTAYTGGTPTAIGGYSKAVPNYATLSEILGLPSMTSPNGYPGGAFPGTSSGTTNGNRPSSTPPNVWAGNYWPYGQNPTHQWEGTRENGRYVPIQNRASGGYISGPGTGTSDSIPARLSNGEYVVKASSVSKYGKGMMDAINTQRFASGGLVGDLTEKPGMLGKAAPKFVQGRQFPGRQKTTTPDSTTGPLDVGTTGTPTSPNPTTTPFPGGGGPNGWPYSNFPQASGKVPGTGVSLYMNKDVLPLFLAFASDYNRLIRPINTLYGLSSRPGTFSNHPSGTAIDINPSDEGAHYSLFMNTEAERQANYNWWMGKKSALAPWSSKSKVPYKTMNALIDKYRVLQWFGPAKLGGPSWLDWTSTDPMHVQINQDTDPSPSMVSRTIASLGINPDGTFNAPKTYAAGGFVRGMGGPRSDMIPAMLSNGEYVIKANAVSKYGRGMLDQINAGNFGVGNAQQPTFTMPTTPMAPSGINNYGGDSSNVKIVINGASGKSATAIANKVASMINSSNNRRNHSRSI